MVGVLANTRHFLANQILMQLSVVLSARASLVLLLSQQFVRVETAQVVCLLVSNCILSRLGGHAAHSSASVTLSHLIEVVRSLSSFAGVTADTHRLGHARDNLLSTSLVGRPRVLSSHISVRVLHEAYAAS